MHRRLLSTAAGKSSVIISYDSDNRHQLAYEIPQVRLDEDHRVTLDGFLGGTVLQTLLATAAGGSSGGLGDLLSALGQDHLNVARAGHVRVDATVGPVCSAAKL